MDGQDHIAEFQAITNEIVALKNQRAKLETRRANSAAAVQKMNMAVSLLDEAPPELTEWDETLIRQLVDTVKVISADQIEVYLQGGIVVTRKLIK